MFARLFALETFGIKLGLDNIARLCAALGHPERQFTAVHVAGTNGKGSVTAMVHAALVCAGVRAGRYISPHLVHLRERIVVGQTPVDDAHLADVATLVLDMAERLRERGELKAYPTFFEATTAAAFELFRRARVDVAVIEVGLGGRYDATNVLAPPVGAITSIGLDHQQYLGATLEAIAAEKAGIIKPGMTVVAGPLPSAAERVVQAVALERGARLVGSADATSSVAMHGGRAKLEITTSSDHYGPLLLGLRGEHQVANAVVAVQLLEALRTCGISIPTRAVEEGLQTVEWPARLELLEIGGRRVLLDAAHNVEGAQALAAYLGRWHPEQPTLVISVMGDKDIDGILGALLPVTSRIISTEAPTPRALPATDLAARVRALVPGRAVEVERDPIGAVELGLAVASSICVAGSIFLAGAVRDRLRERGAA